MTERIAVLREYISNGRHRSCRREVHWSLAEMFAAEKTSPVKRTAAALCAVLKEETPCFIPGSRIAFMRTVANLPELYTAEEVEALKKQFSYSEKGVPFNFTPDYASVMKIGLPAFRRKIVERMASADEVQTEFLQCALDSLDALLELIGRYISEAHKRGFETIAANLEAIRSRAPERFAEALQLFRVLHYTLWCEGGYHIGAGRLDILLYPWYRHDVENGLLSEEEAFELLEEFFLTFNIDSDLYTGVQQGDNGQSLMIGGCDRNGNEVWNVLSEKILLASCELKLIDPKINFRVSSKTPLERLAMGSRLTRAGLGFPQYSNDDVVIPALQKWGYSLEDARDYSCAACWEFIIPGVCHEFINLDGISLPDVLMTAAANTSAVDFEQFCADLKQEFRKRAVALLERYQNISVMPAAFISVLCPVALEAARNITEAGRYHNWGVHGTGFGVAADSLAAIRELIFETKKMTMPELLEVLDDNFAHAPELRAELRSRMPKLGGRESERAAGSLVLLTRMWAEAWENLTNAQGGVICPGTGSAMYYIWHSENFPATPDGRLAGEPFSANFSPALDVPLEGPLTVIRAFAAPDLTGVCNGGPLTIELHDSVFSSADAEEKVAAMIGGFIRLGGHQLQLNTLNSNVLRDAQKHPEKYRELIVRVWGWSGRFVELDKIYQDHIIRRCGITYLG
ncbi:MAG: pyruvate formate-lyase [Lentisphaeria bacterium]|nr:pyruvate formate-lyase [Lentisphaeria bacterium]